MSNSSAHPGLVDRASQQTRRTRTQIEEDNARTLSATNSARQEAEAKRQASIRLLAMTEDAVESEEQEVQRYAKRPDLRLDPKTPGEQVDSETESETGLVAT